MRTLFWSTLVLTAACTPGSGRTESQYLKRPTQGLGVAVGPIDLRSALGFGDVVLQIGSERNDVDETIVNSYAADFEVISPSGVRYAPEEVSRSIPQSPSLEPAEIRGVVPVGTERGWYEVRAKLASGDDATIEDRVIHIEGVAYVANRFAFDALPTVRRIAACDTKIRVELSEPVKRKTGEMMIDVRDADGTPLICDEALDDAGTAVTLSCNVPGHFALAVNESIVGALNDMPVRDVDETRFARVIDRNAMRSDGSCQYVTP